jgi:hypothetical protein
VKRTAGLAGCGAEFFGGGHRVGLRLLLADGARDVGCSGGLAADAVREDGSHGAIVFFYYLVI